jgi:hypothetical protein
MAGFALRLKGPRLKCLHWVKPPLHHSAAELQGQGRGDMACPDSRLTASAPIAPLTINPLRPSHCNFIC